MANSWTKLLNIFIKPFVRFKSTSIQFTGKFSRCLKTLIYQCPYIFTHTSSHQHCFYRNHIHPFYHHRLLLLFSTKIICLLQIWQVIRDTPISSICNIPNFLKWTHQRNPNSLLFRLNKFYFQVFTFFVKFLFLFFCFVQSYYQELVLTFGCFYLILHKLLFFFHCLNTTAHHLYLIIIFFFTFKQSFQFILKPLKLLFQS